MNEPLSALQRLCEELEYSELLDQASDCPDPFDRMVRVAAFAVSGYALAAHRAGRKPFNPILGETYECIREDKGFKFIAEQVSCFCLLLLLLLLLLLGGELLQHCIQTATDSNNKDATM